MNQSEPHSTLADRLIALRPSLLRHAHRLTRNPTEAEDLVHDTIERAIRFQDKFEEGSNLRAWTHQILANAFISRCRSARREGRALLTLLHDPEAWTSGVTQQTKLQTLVPATSNAISALPDPFRVTLMLVDLQEMSYRDAAQQLGIPVGTIMSRLHRARRMLAEALQDAA